MRIQWKAVFRALLVLLILFMISLSLPAVRDRVAWRWDQVRIWMRYTFFPPEEAVFIPKESKKTPAFTLTLTLTPPPTSTPLTPTNAQTEEVESPPTILPDPTHTHTPTPTPLPARVTLEGVRYEHQHGLWNYCAPANLAMALSYWGWEGDRMDVGRYLKPEEYDKNVMPYEMVNYITNETDLSAVLRPGGTIELLKLLIANEFPVLIEKGVFTRETLTGRMAWMGHYALLVGYDDAEEHFISRDSYYSPPDYPLDFPISYEEIIKEWRGFNYKFLVIYSPELEEDLFPLLGSFLDEDFAYQNALERAIYEVSYLEEMDLFLAWFNRGTNLVYLYDYGNAAQAFDEAFRLYAELSKEIRPYRLMWYRTEPYFAYYYTGRYQDVIDLATTTIDAADKPYLEESWYWRAKAKIALGDRDGAIRNLQTSLEYHPGYVPSLEELEALGVSD